MKTYYWQFSLVAQGMFDWLQQEGPPLCRLRKDQVVELSQQPFIHTQAWQPCPISFVIKLSNQLILCRLDKINSLVKKGQPLKQWSCRGMGEVKARLEVIINYISTFSLVPRKNGSLNQTYHFWRRWSIPQNENPLLHIRECFLKVELTARRTLSFLSGGDLVPLLGDILYPSEKELLAERQVL